MRLRMVVASLLAGGILVPTTVSGQTTTPTPSGGEPSAPSVEERMSNTESMLARLEKLGISGYAQVRATYEKDATPLTNLFVRRARLNFRHTGDRSRLAISVDGGQGTVTVQDAYFDLTAIAGRGQRQGLILRAGQFYRPF